MSLRWGTRCVACHCPRDAHWLTTGPCRSCYCRRYGSPWWISLRNALRRRFRDRV